MNQHLSSTRLKAALGTTLQILQVLVYYSHAHCGAGAGHGGTFLCVPEALELDGTCPCRTPRFTTQTQRELKQAWKLILSIWKRLFWDFLFGCSSGLPWDFHQSHRLNSD